jgi:transposase
MRMCELLVGLPKVSVLGIFGRSGQPLFIHIESRGDAPVGCPTCRVIARVKDRSAVELADLASFGRSARIVRHKVRWCCADPDCAMGSWTEENRAIAAPRMAMTDRAGRWVTEQVGRCARSVAEVAKELGYDWHTVNNAVLSWGAALVDEPGRYGSVVALGLDEVLFVRRGSSIARSSRPASATSWLGSSSILFLVAVPSCPTSGSRTRARPGARRCATAPWTSRVPTALSSTRCCRRPPRWLIHFMW